MSDHLGAAPRMRDRRAVERGFSLGPDLPDPRHLNTEAMRAQLGIVWCRTCQQDCLPLSTGICGWCGNPPDTAGSAKPKVGQRACRQCQQPFDDPHGKGHAKLYCGTRCSNLARAARRKVRGAA